MITNGSERLQRAKIQALEIESFFSSILISETVGLKKPDPRIYIRCLTELGVLAEKAVMVGDHPALDIDGPRSVGMRTVWFEDRFWGDCESADATIQDLERLPSTIGAL